MAKLTLLFGNDPQGEYALSQPEYTIGRSHECDIVVDNLGVSRHHASVVADGDKWKVVDQGSNNGTFINDRQVSQHILEHQDRIVLGKFSLVFDAYGEASSPANSESSGSAKAGGGASMGSEMTMFVDPDQIKKMQADLKAGGNAQRMTLQMRMGNRDANCPLVKSDTIIGSKKGGDVDLPIRGFLVKPIQAKVSKTDQGHRLIAMGGLRSGTRQWPKGQRCRPLRSGDVIVIAGNTITYKSA